MIYIIKLFVNTLGRMYLCACWISNCIHDSSHVPSWSSRFDCLCHSSSKRVAHFQLFYTKKTGPISRILTWKTIMLILSCISWILLSIKSGSICYWFLTFCYYWFQVPKDQDRIHVWVQLSWGWACGVDKKPMMLANYFGMLLSVLYFVHANWYFKI